MIENLPYWRSHSPFPFFFLEAEVKVFHWASDLYVVNKCAVRTRIINTVFLMDK